MPPTQPNVILILTDDQGYGDVSAHGNPILDTPNIDRLRRESLSFTDFHVAPMCTPTRGELLTGCDALRNGASFVCRGRTMMRHDLPTMADIFADNGYRTGLFGKWHLGDSYPHRPQDRGFHETVNHGGWGITAISDYWGNDYWDDTYRHQDRFEQYTGYCTDVWFDEAIDWMADHYTADHPFFCYIPTNCPHGPHWVDDNYSAPYESESGIEDDTVAKFFGQIANIDENLGRLLAWLDQDGRGENTILIFMTDNGTVLGHEIFNAGMRGHKRSLYDGGHRVPCFIRWPAGELGPPREIDELTQGQDLLPTLIELCGLTPPDGASFDGASLGDLLFGKREQLSDRMLVVQYGPDPEMWDSAVLWGDWRLVAGEELYNIAEDPGQTNDVADQYPEVIQRMREYYEDWWTEAIDAFETTKYIHIGAEQANPAVLYSNDWRGSYADNFNNMAEGTHTGYWNIRIETNGTYRFDLARWPFEAEVALTDDIEGPRGMGQARPISEARLRVGGRDVSKQVDGSNSHATFTIELTAGETRVETWFYDDDGTELCSAYQTRVQKL